MIKLVASDLDGTILLNGAQKVDQSLIHTIDQLIEQNNILFAPASGRQLTSLKRLFEPISDKLMYISENGALVKYHDQILVKTAMDRSLAMDIIEDVYKMPNCELLISGENTAYIKPKTKEYEYRMTKVVNYHTTFVDDFRDIQEDIIKIAVCDMTGIEHSSERIFKRWQGKAAIAVSGALYLDFMESSVSKGDALKKVQKKLGISADECMAFGDNFNDITMLDSVVDSYVMDTAVDEVKKHGKYIVSNVEKTLCEQFLGGGQ
jgi:Cof subfamily protein (haloacid dehalogenase superfamily)